MTPGTKIAVIVLSLIAVGVSATQGGSIWARSHRRTRELFTDDIARDIGDILHIIIAEKTLIETETNRAMDKSTDRSANIGGTIDFKDIATFLSPLVKRSFDFPKVDFSSKSNTKFTGGVDYDTDRSMDDQIAVVVEDVLPNGNLIIIGNRIREYAGDSQVITISGIVRPTDISFDNTISSKKVASFHIVHRTVGRENRFVNPGWLTRLANMLNPF